MRNEKIKLKKNSQRSLGQGNISNDHFGAPMVDHFNAITPVSSLPRHDLVAQWCLLGTSNDWQGLRWSEHKWIVERNKCFFDYEPD